jgi:hypothetical protein
MTPSPAVAPGRTPQGLVFLSAPGNDSVAAIAGTDAYLYVIYKLAH